jgi:hypothetical protein
MLEGNMTTPNFGIHSFHPWFQIQSWVRSDETTNQLVIRKDLNLCFTYTQIQGFHNRSMLQKVTICTSQMPLKGILQIPS